MLPQTLFILFITLLLLVLLVPIGRYRIYRDRFTGRPVAREEEPAEVDASIGVGITMMLLFLILFPLLLAGSVWIAPHGPLFMGFAWVPIVVMGVILALVLALLLPRDTRETRDHPETEKSAPTRGLGVFVILYFLLLVLILSVIFIGYT